MRVLVAAPSAVMRAGLTALLTAEGAIEVVGEATRATLVDQIERSQPDVVLLDLKRGESLPPGLPLAPGEPGPPIFVLLSDTDDAAEAFGQGFRAILPRDADSAAITAAVQAVAAGLAVLPPTDLDALLTHLPTRTGTPVLAEPLTPREIEVLSMLAEGAGNKAIARRLNISEHTVKFHVGSILGKLGAASRTEAVTIGIRQGLIML